MLSIKDPIKNEIPKAATREGYGKGLAEIGKKYSNVVVMDADLSGSTKTKEFASHFPDRFFNFGVAEQGMVAHAAGMSLSGLIPVASSFAIFLAGRAWEIVRNSIAYPDLNVKLVASHAGITVGEDGASHQVIEDIGLMRCMPHMKVMVPADYWQAFHTIKAAIEDTGPVYVRLGRSKIPIIYAENTPVTIGKANIIQEGGNRVAFFAIGSMVYEAWKAARILEEKHAIRPWVVDAVSVKPMDSDTLIHVSKKVKKVFTFEEHNVLTGFGSAVAELLSQTFPIEIQRIGMQDEFGQSGTAEALMEHYGLTASKIVEQIKDSIP